MYSLYGTVYKNEKLLHLKNISFTGYVHSGLIYKAVRLFGDMCTIKGEPLVFSPLFVAE